MFIFLNNANSSYILKNQISYLLLASSSSSNTYSIQTSPVVSGKNIASTVHIYARSTSICVIIVLNLDIYCPVNINKLS